MLNMLTLKNLMIYIVPSYIRNKLAGFIAQLFLCVCAASTIFPEMVLANQAVNDPSKAIAEELSKNLLDSIEKGQTSKCGIKMEVDGGFKNLDFQLIQRELSARNLYDGAIDGIMGPKACKGFLLYLKYILRKTENTYTKKDHYRTRTYLMGSRKREKGNFFLKASFLELPKNERVKIQEKLSQLNFYTLTIDGLFGAGTEKAIEKYSQNFFKEKTYNEMEKAPLLLQHIIEASCYSNAAICSDDEICTQATDLKNGLRLWDTKKYSERFIVEAEKRGLSCDVAEEIDLGAELTAESERDIEAKTSITFSVDHSNEYVFDPYECGFKASYVMPDKDALPEETIFYYNPNENKYLAKLELNLGNKPSETIGLTFEFEDLEGSFCKPLDLTYSSNFNISSRKIIHKLNVSLVKSDVEVELLQKEKLPNNDEPQGDRSLSDLLGLDGENYTEGNEASSDVDNRLNEAVAAQQAVEEELRVKNKELKNSEANLLKAQRKSDLLNQQVLSLRQELVEMEELLAISEEKSTESEAQLQNLGNRLNAALARAASEQRRRVKLEEAERQLLEAEKAIIDNERKRLETLVNELQNDKVRWSAREKVLNKQLREFKESLNEALTRAAMEQAKRLKLEQQLVD